MTKEEIIADIVSNTSIFDTTKLCNLVWNAAIEAAAEELKVGITTHPKHITSLKFKTDENN